MRKYLIILIIIFLSCCHKQEQYVNNHDSDVSAAASDVSQNTVVFENRFPQFPPLETEDITGIWSMFYPDFKLEMEFSDNGILYIREFNNNINVIANNFYPYKIRVSNIVLENTDKNNDFGDDVNRYLLQSNIYLQKTDNGELFLAITDPKYNWVILQPAIPLFRGTVEELAGIIKNKIFNDVFDNNLEEFIYNEVLMLNRKINDYDITDENSVTNFYGEPIRDEIIEYSDGRSYAGGLILTGIREITYEDLLHRYYIFNKGVPYYVEAIVSEKLDRLTTINIGATSEEVITVFGENYSFKEGKDIVYRIDEGIRMVKFSIENNIVNKITFIITSWGVRNVP